MTRSGDTIDSGKARDRQASQTTTKLRQLWLRPQFVFPLLGLILGLALTILTAPFQAPDEPQHFLRAYQISEGGIVPSRQNHRGGGDLPVSVSRITERFAAIRFHPEVKISWNEIGSALQVPLEPGKRRFTPFVTSIYSPIGYLPQSAGIWLGRRWDCPPLGLMYLARIFNLLGWLTLGTVALHLTPVNQRAFLMLLLMPMSLFQAASMSADATTNGLAVLFTAVVLRHVIREARVSLSAWIAVALVSAALTLTKFAYLPLAALVLLIPPSHCGGIRRYFAAAVVIALVNLSALLAWAPQTHGLDTVVRDQSDVSPRGQLEYLRTHPAAVIKVPAYTFARDGYLFFRSFVGRLGSMDAKMSVAFIIPYFVALMLACWLQQTPVPPYPVWRIALLIVPLLVISLLGIAMLNYIYWTPIGSRGIDGMQGRYFLPLAPAMLIAVWSLTRPFAPHPWARWADWKLNSLAVLLVLISGIYTLIVVYHRYHGGVS
jgi:uncharacterized membrane protein